jgi:hypothetical protein
LNRPPVFTSEPDVEAMADKPYRYEATARDPDSDPLRFSVVAGPVGLAVEALTGVVTWTPTPADVGNHTVTLRVEDGGAARPSRRILWSP